MHGIKGAGNIMMVHDAALEQVRHFRLEQAI